MFMDLEEYRRPLKEGLSEVEIYLTDKQLDFALQEAKKNDSTIDEVIEDIVRKYLDSEKES